jgi:hypothetical protein
MTSGKRYTIPASFEGPGGRLIIPEKRTENQRKPGFYYQRIKIKVTGVSHAAWWGYTAPDSATIKSDAGVMQNTPTLPVLVEHWKLPTRDE